MKKKHTYLCCKAGNRGSPLKSSFEMCLTSTPREAASGVIAKDESAYQYPHGLVKTAMALRNSISLPILWMSHQAPCSSWLPQAFLLTLLLNQNFTGSSPDLLLLFGASEWFSRLGYPIYSPVGSSKFPSYILSSLVPCGEITIQSEYSGTKLNSAPLCCLPSPPKMNHPLS